VSGFEQKKIKQTKQPKTKKKKNQNGFLGAASAREREKKKLLLWEKRPGRKTKNAKKKGTLKTCGKKDCRLPRRDILEEDVIPKKSKH